MPRCTNWLVVTICFWYLSLTSPCSATSLVDGVEVAKPSLVNIVVTPKIAAKQDETSAPATSSKSQSAASKTQDGHVDASGIVISPDGYVLTIAELLNDAQDIEIRTVERKSYKAKLVGRDRLTGIALLKFEATGLQPAKIGDDSKLRLGQSVFSAGLLPESLGLVPVVTDGMVSVRDSAGNIDIVPMIQTTSMIGPGMGGSGLFTATGELVGVNSIIYSGKTPGQLLYFAIPINTAMELVPSLKDFGRVRRSGLGLQLGVVTDEVANTLQLPRLAGVLVQRVEPNGPADKGDVRPGDVILRLGELNINRFAEFPKFLSRLQPGTNVSLQIWRKGTLKDITVTTREVIPKQ